MIAKATRYHLEIKLLQMPTRQGLQSGSQYRLRGTRSKCGSPVGGPVPFLENRVHFFIGTISKAMHQIFYQSFNSCRVYLFFLRILATFHLHQTLDVFIALLNLSLNPNSPPQSPAPPSH